MLSLVEYIQLKYTFISIIVEDSEATKRVIIKECATPEDWNKISKAAKNYQYAAQSKDTEVPENWPNSWYGLPFGIGGRTANNSNTFIRHLANQIGKDADAIDGIHPGNATPQPVTHPGWTPLKRPANHPDWHPRKL